MKKCFTTTTRDIDVVSIIHDVRFAIQDAKATNGLVTIAVPAPGAGLLIMEALPELIDGVKAAVAVLPGEGVEALTRRKEVVAVGPRIKETLVARSLTLPLADGMLLLAPREEVLLVDCEARVQRREYVIQVWGEAPEPKAAPPKRPLGRIG